MHHKFTPSTVPAHVPLSENSFTVSMSMNWQPPILINPSKEFGPLKSLQKTIMPSISYYHTKASKKLPSCPSANPLRLFLTVKLVSCRKSAPSQFNKWVQISFCKSMKQVCD